MKFPSSTSVVSEFEAWALPPHNGLKPLLVVKRYSDPDMNAAFKGFMRCYYWLQSEAKKQEGTNTSDVLQNDKARREEVFEKGLQKLLSNGYFGKTREGKSHAKIHFVKLGDKESLDMEGLSVGEMARMVFDSWFDEPSEKPSAAAKEGVKYDQGKAPMDLLDPYAIEQLALVLAFGAKKYAAHNWRNGINSSRLIAAALRHIFALSNGEDTDPETGLSHAAHAMCCCMFLVWTLKFKPEFDDRVKL